MALLKSRHPETWPGPDQGLIQPARRSQAKVGTYSSSYSIIVKHTLVILNSFQDLFAIHFTLVIRSLVILNSFQDLFATNFRFRTYPFQMSVTIFTLGS